MCKYFTIDNHDVITADWMVLVHEIDMIDRYLWSCGKQSYITSRCAQYTLLWCKHDEP